MQSPDRKDQTLRNLSIAMNLQIKETKNNKSYLVMGKIVGELKKGY